MGEPGEAPRFTAGQDAHGVGGPLIASSLFVGENTVKAHVSRVPSQLGVRSRTRAALHAGRARVW